MRYRPDIDGLRAIAVAVVILFHAHIPYFSGGFVGVDIFFVISGFLITTVIRERIEDGTFTFKDFYIRRIRRLFPALIGVFLFCLIASVFILIPSEMEEFGLSFLSTLLMSANIYFWIDASDYFASAQDTKFLLHMWSLSVEEQFYLIFPILFLIAFRVFRKHMLLVMLIGTIAFFWLAEYILYHDPNAAFYMLPARAWELLLGGLLCFVPTYKRFESYATFLALLGITLSFYAVFQFDSKTLFPGHNALVPCAAGLLIIYAGSLSSHNFVSRILRLVPVVYIGKISYSLYIWHWPVFMVFAAYKMDAVSPLETFMLIVATFIVSVFSYHFIEQPFRRKTIFSHNRTICLFFVGTSILFSVFAFNIWHSGGWKGRFDTSSLDILKVTSEFNGGRRACFAGHGKVMEPEDGCVVGDMSQDVSLALWGDSHAESISSLITNVAEEREVAAKLFLHGGCSPIQGVIRLGTGHKGRCLDVNDKILDYILSAETIKTVVLHARFSVLWEGKVSYGNAEQHTRTEVASSDGKTVSETDKYGFLYERLLETVETLNKANKKVIIIAPTPEIGFHVPKVLLRASLRGQNLSEYGVARSLVMSRHSEIIRVLKVLERMQLATIIWPYDAFCDDDMCFVYEDGHVFYRDDDHLSIRGAEKLKPLLNSALYP